MSRSSGSRREAIASSDEQRQRNSSTTLSKSTPVLEDDSSSYSIDSRRDRRREYQAIPVKPPPVKEIDLSKLKKETVKTKSKKVKKSKKSTYKKDDDQYSVTPGFGKPPALLLTDTDVADEDDDDMADDSKSYKRRFRDDSSRKSKRKSKKNGNDGDIRMSRSAAGDLFRSTPRGKVPSKSNSVVGISDRPPSSSIISDKPKKIDISEDMYVAILSLPNESSESDSDRMYPNDASDMIRRKPGTPKKLPIPPRDLPKGDGLTPLETIAPDTIDCNTNAFRNESDAQEKKNSTQEKVVDISYPVQGWLKFQVPAIPRPDDVEKEREATQTYSIHKLLQQAKVNT